MIYLAGSCSSEYRTLMTNIAKILRNMNYDVYCPFELKIQGAWDISQEEWSKKVFQKDLEAIDKADIFLMISSGRIGSAGTNWEQGYAYAKKKLIFVFQFTDEPTSLMTYSSCDYFHNSTSYTICKDILDFFSEYKNGNKTVKESCKTILT